MEDAEDEIFEMKHLASSSSSPTGGVAVESMSKSTAMDHLDSSNSSPPQFIQIHCLIERSTADEHEQHTHAYDHARRLDVKTKIPTSILFRDLVHTILITNGFRDIDIFGAKGAIEFKEKWKPLSLEAVTDDPSATVGEILGNVAAHLTLRIQLYRTKMFNELQEMKKNLFFFLLSHSEKFLRDAGCPLDKERINDILRGHCRVSLETKAKFDEWCMKQSRLKTDVTNINQHVMNINVHDVTNINQHVMNINVHDVTNINQHVMNINVHDVTNINDLIFNKQDCLHSTGEAIAPTLPRDKMSTPRHNGDATETPDDTAAQVLTVGPAQNGEVTTVEWMHNPVDSASSRLENTQNGIKPFSSLSIPFYDDIDVTTEERRRLHRWFSKNRRPSRDDMTRYLNKLNSVRSRLKRRSLLTLDKIVQWSEDERAAENFDFPRVSNGARTNCADESTRKSPSVDDDDDSSSLGSIDDEERVPYLPNKNAVYVVKPLCVGEEDAANGTKVVVDAVSGGGADTDAEDVVCCDRRDAAPTSDLRRKTKRTRLDENHNCYDCPSFVTNVDFSSPNDVATDLTVRDKRTRDEPPTDARREVASPPPQNHPICLWPIKRLKEDSKENDRRLSSSSSSPDVSGNVAIAPSPFVLHPHLRTFRQHQQHAFQMAMSQALLMHSVTAIYQNHQPQPMFAMTTTTYDDDNQDSSGSVDGDRKKRSRVFIDPLTEIPRLERWFQDDSHPSSYAIEQYTDQLNRLAYRQRFPRLEPKNVQLWFKNHRAKVKRKRPEDSPPHFLPNGAVYIQ